MVMCYGKVTLNLAVMVGLTTQMELQTTDVIDMVDPSGGPYIRAGQMLSHIIGYGIDEINVIVESFERVDTGYIIKCKEHEYVDLREPNDNGSNKTRTIKFK
jgi:hypothetical protein